MKVSNHNLPQGGFAIILVVVAIGIIALLWLGSKESKIVTDFKNKGIESDISEIKSVKERLLEFAVLTPELYESVDLSNLTSPLVPIDVPLGPGYLPCPDDVDGHTADADDIADWATCSNSSSDILSGKLPQQSNSSSTDFYFAEAGKYNYYVDKRFVVPLMGTKANGHGVFTPLTPYSIFNDTPDAPVLTLNGAGGYVALIVDPGSDDSFSEFSISGNNATYTILNASNPSYDPTVDKVVGIRYEQDWIPLLGKRVCTEMPRYRGSDATGYSKTSGTFVEDVASITTAANWFYYDPVNDYSWYDWSKDLCP